MSGLGIERAATVLLALGDGAAGKVLAYLTPDEVTRLGQAMRTLGTVPRARLKAALDAFEAEFAEQTGLGADPVGVLVAALERAWPEEAVSRIRARLEAPDLAGLEQLTRLAAPELAGRLAEAPRHVVVGLLSAMPRTQAAMTLACLPPDRRAAVLATLSDSRPDAPEIRAAVRDWLQQQAMDMPTGNPDDEVAALLQRMPEAEMRSTLDALDGTDAELATRMRARLVTIDDLADMPAADRRTFLRHADPAVLLMALRGSDSRLVDALAAVLTPAAAQRMRDELALTGGVEVTAVQSARDAVSSLLRRLAAEGMILRERNAS